MKAIQLSQGYHAIVDDEDFDMVSGFNWYVKLNPNGKAYAVRNNKRDPGPKVIKMHRVLMNATNRAIDVDHINGDALDNRRANLRLATRSQNSGNIRVVRSNSGFKGVTKKRLNKWRAEITVRLKKVDLGSHFCTPQEAAYAYDAAALKYFGEYAATNKSLGLLP